MKHYNRIVWILKRVTLKAIEFSLIYCLNLVGMASVHWELQPILITFVKDVKVAGNNLLKLLKRRVLTSFGKVQKISTLTGGEQIWSLKRINYQQK